jgi:hypothetical protein
MKAGTSASSISTSAGWNDFSPFFPANCRIKFSKFLGNVA